VTEQVNLRSLEVGILSYLDLVDETKRQYPALYRYVKVFDRETGADRHSSNDILVR
jgi:hypothetical protein